MREPCKVLRAVPSKQSVLTEIELLLVLSRCGNKEPWKSLSRKLAVRSTLCKDCLLCKEAAG